MTEEQWSTMGGPPDASAPDVAAGREDAAASAGPADRSLTPAGPPQPRRAPRRLLAAVIAVVLVAAALAGLAAVQLGRPMPDADLRLTLANSLVIPGQVTGVPWPARGQARLDVEGLGTIGQSGGDRPVPIGSVAKVMTAYLVLADHPLKDGQSGPAFRVTAADVADYRARIPSHQSLLPVTVGEQLTERQALEALLLPSANNVAQMLAVWDAGSVDAFVAKMNSTARQLGLTATHYTDPSGFAPTTVSTAADQTLLAERALTVPAFAAIVALPTATLPVAGTVHNYNDLLGTDGVFGVKTGSTGEAGGNLVFAAHLSVGQRTVTVVGTVLGQPGADARAELAAVMAASRGLITAADRIVRPYTLLPPGPVGVVSGQKGPSVTVRSVAPLEVIGWPGLRIPVAAKPAHIGPQVHAGQTVGTLTAGEGSGASAVDLRADASLPRPSWWQRLTRTS